MNYHQPKQDSQQDLYQPNFQTYTVDEILCFTIDRGLNQKQYWKTDGTTKGTICLHRD